MSSLMQSSMWSDKYIKLAKEISTWSKDPSTKIGAVVVGADGQILSQGFNGFPRGIKDSEERLNNRERKYELVVHGEMNAIYNASLNGVSLKDSTIYVYGLPTCNECAKGIIQVGIKKVVAMRPAKYNSDWDKSNKNAAALFKEADVTYLIKVEEVDG
jgi:dCMP deaminase|tara:strand:- start:851 stop:1324 length:474 start_codon:yes stop_codon:yes gene_type:complete